MLEVLSGRRGSTDPAGAMVEGAVSDLKTLPLGNLLSTLLCESHLDYTESHFKRKLSLMGQVTWSILQSYP